ncbi:hypothetical protein Salat_0721500 [Sesamum alatum]|uniref:Uncharacterized protein n=1 Tax=Sesamum alatum TaxID=300844 RepID=A0AAE1YSD2_9LAMI|nr:hypothetical protein Salat_0721500 [Sesamum alatum]
MEPFPSLASKFLFEYLLLPPRSTLTTAPPVHAQGLAVTVVPSYSSELGSCPDGRASTKFPLASSSSGIVHHLLGPDRYTHSNLSQKFKIGRRCTLQGGSHRSASLCLTGLLVVDSHTCQSYWSVFQDGSNGEPVGQHQERAIVEGCQRRALFATIRATTFHGHIDCPSFGRRRINPAGPRLESIGGQALAVPHSTRVHHQPPFAFFPTISRTI